ncbi:hypothetical protein C8R46DRAFT_1212935 [Mycena filopes]|nr:hypothetical protein C8R46DRAFT_1212935 [Mycena filopes]
MATRCPVPFYPDPGEPNSPAGARKIYLVMGKNVSKPGAYTSWPSADVQYRTVSSATVKGYKNWAELEGACACSALFYALVPVLVVVAPACVLTIDVILPTCLLALQILATAFILGLAGALGYISALAVLAGFSTCVRALTAPGPTRACVVTRTCGRLAVLTCTCAFCFASCACAQGKTSCVIALPSLLALPSVLALPCLVTRLSPHTLLPHTRPPHTDSIAPWLVPQTGCITARRAAFPCCFSPIDRRAAERHVAGNDVGGRRKRASRQDGGARSLYHELEAQGFSVTMAAGPSLTDGVSFVEDFAVDGPSLEARRRRQWIADEFSARSRHLNESWRIGGVVGSDSGSSSDEESDISLYE